MLDKVKPKNFKDIVGSTAVLTIMDGPDIDLTVEDVIEPDIKKDEGERPKEARKDPFTLVLSGPEAHQAKDGMYDLTFDKVGLLESVFVDNKSDIPECAQFNEALQEKAAKAVAAAKAKKSKKAKTEKAKAEEASADAELPTEPEPRVLYEITFG